MVLTLAESRVVRPVLELPTEISSYTPLPESPPELDPDGISYKIMRTGDFYTMCQVLIKRVLPHKDKFQAVVYPLRGGLFPGIAVAHALNLPVYSIGVSHYQGVEAGSEASAHNLSFYAPLDRSAQIQGLDVLLVDDVVHNGDTAKGLLEDLTQNQGARSVKIAALHEKPMYNTKVVVDYVIEQTSAWIVYPWEHLGSTGLIDGNVLHQPYEFFVEKFPVWMIRKENGQFRGETLPESLKRASQIGFREEELPRLDNSDFLGRLATALNARYQDKELFGQSIPRELLSELLEIEIKGTTYVNDGSIINTGERKPWII